MDNYTEKHFIYLHSLVLVFYGFETGLIYSAISPQLVELYAISSISIWERTEKLIKCNL